MGALVLYGIYDPAGDRWFSRLGKGYVQWSRSPTKKGLFKKVPAMARILKILPGCQIRKFTLGSGETVERADIN